MKNSFLQENPKDFPAQATERLKQLQEQIQKLKEELKKQEEEEEVEKPPVFLLTSQCLNISSTSEYLKKYNKDKESNMLIQMFLKTYDYQISVIDGIFGNETEKALKQFQEDNNLTGDGVFGKETSVFIDKTCNKLKVEEKELKEEKENKEKQENPSDFPAKDPAKQKGNIEGKSKIQNPNIQILDKWIEQRFNEQVKDNRELSKILRKTILKSKGPTEALSTVTVLALSGLYGLTDNISSFMGSGFIDLRKKFEIVLKGKEEKEFFFKIHKNTANKEKHNPNKNTVIIIHGFRSEPTDWVEEIAQAYNNGNNEILLLNWKEVVKILNYSQAISSVSKAEPKLRKILQDWEIEPNQTIIIGHSLGTILGGELSQNLGKVKKLIALDPAIKTGRKDTFFKNKSQNTICISTWGSDLSNEKFLNYCDQSFLINSNFVQTPVLAKHSLPHNIYRQLLYKNTIYNYLISWNTNLPKHDKIQAEVENETKIKIDGWLNVKNNFSTKLSNLEMKKENRTIKLGSEIDNEFSCEKSVCEFGGWFGDDIYIQKDRDFIIKDFMKERKKENGKKEIDADKLIVKNISKDDIIPTTNGVYLRIKFKDWWGNEKTTFVFLKGIDEGEVKEWVDIALGKGKYENWDPILLKAKQDDNPIKLE